MTVGELRKALEGVPDDATVYVFDWEDCSPTRATKTYSPGDTVEGWELDNDVVIV